MKKQTQAGSLYTVKGLPRNAGCYYACFMNKETGKHYWQQLYFSPDVYDPVWEKVICWSYT